MSYNWFYKALGILKDFAVIFGIKRFAQILFGSNGSSVEALVVLFLIVLVFAVLGAAMGGCRLSLPLLFGIVSIVILLCMLMEWGSSRVYLQMLQGSSIWVRMNMVIKSIDEVDLFLMSGLYAMGQYVGYELFGGLLLSLIGIITFVTLGTWLGGVRTSGRLQLEIRECRDLIRYLCEELREEKIWEKHKQELLSDLEELFDKKEGTRHDRQQKG